MNLTFIQGHSHMRIREILCVSFLTNLPVNLDEILYAAMTCYSV